MVFIFLPKNLSASETNGSINSTNSYAWSNEMGWINFNTTEGAVSITDSQITGHAWSEIFGWINLSPTNSGITNDGEGDLSGDAWGEHLGWINFSGVTIDSSGNFLGYATGTVSDQISMNCINTNSCANSNFKVSTDWRPKSARSSCNNSSDDDGDGLVDYPDDPGCSSLSDTDETDETTGNPGGGGGCLDCDKELEKPELGKFSVTINNGAKTTTNNQVTIQLDGGPEAVDMSISESPTFEKSSKEKYNTEKNWAFSPELGEKTIYVKFFNDKGKSTETISASIILKEKSFVSSPEILSPKNNSVVYELPIKISGVGASITEIIAKLGETEYSIKSKESGDFEFIILETIPYGTHTLLIYQKNELGSISEPTQITLTYQEKKQKEEDHKSEEEEKLIKDKTTDLKDGSEQVYANKTTETPQNISEEQNLPTTKKQNETVSSVEETIKETKKRQAYLVVNTGKSVAFSKRQTQKIETTGNEEIEIIIRPIETTHSITGRLYKNKEEEDQGFNSKNNSKKSIFSRVTDFLKPEKVLAVTKQKSKWIKGYLFSHEKGTNNFFGNIDIPDVPPGEYDLVITMNHKNGEKTTIKKSLSVSEKGKILSTGRCNNIKNVPRARIAVFYKNEENEFAPWPARFYGQENPIITNEIGSYTMHLPAGSYYLSIDAPRHKKKNTEVFTLDEPSIIKEKIILQKNKDNFWYKTIDWLQKLLFGLECVYNQTPQK